MSFFIFAPWCTYIEQIIFWMWTTNVIYIIFHAKFSHVLPYFGPYLRFLVFFKGAIRCAWWVHILFNHCPVFKGCLFHILVGLSLLYHLYRPLRDYMKIGDLAKIPLSNPQMKQITKIKVAKVRFLFHLWVNNYLFSDLVVRYFSIYERYEKTFFFSCT